MKNLLFSIPLFFSALSFAQEIFNEDVIINGNHNLIINGGAIRNDITSPVTQPVKIDDDLSVNGYLGVQGHITADGLSLADGLVEVIDGYPDIFFNGMDLTYLGKVEPWRMGIEFYKSKKPNVIRWGGIGAAGENHLINRIYIAHGANPATSTLGIQILSNGNTGIGTLSPTTRLHIASGALNNSGLRLENLTSNTPSTANAKAIGVTSTGQVVTIDVDGSSSSDKAWLTEGNIKTIASNAAYGNNVNNNFLGTKDSVDLVIATNNKERLRITTTGRLIFHNNSAYTSPNNLNNLYLGGGNETLPVSATNNSANTVMGMGSLKVNTTGYKNTAVGSNLLYKNTTGHQNAVLGSNSMIKNTSGSQNVVIGSNSMNANTSGHYNVAIGNGTLNKNTTGQYNTQLGYYNASTGITSGNRNIGIGFNAGKNITTGANNIIIGNEISSTEPILAPISAISNDQLNIGNWIFGYDGQIAIGEFDNLENAFHSSQDYQLLVKKGIRTEKVRVDLSDVNDWADYVFGNDYEIMPIEELEKFIVNNKHLPNIPKAEELIKNGIDLVEMDSKLLEKIEELTLYNIDLYKENKILKEENEQQQKLLDELVKRIEQLETNK